jgi:hypothetical protein
MDRLSFLITPENRSLLIGAGFFGWPCFRHILEYGPGGEALYIAPKTRIRFDSASPCIFLLESSSG